MGMKPMGRTFNPGEQVFLQGERIPHFFGLVCGRFAKVRTRHTPEKGGLSRALSQAQLIEVIEHPNQVFGEIEALLGHPQQCSVFAIDPSEVLAIPSKSEVFRQAIGGLPRFGIQTCIAFAKRLWNILQYFSRLAREEEALDRLINSSLSSYLALVRDLETLLSNSSDGSILESARSANAYEIALEASRNAQPVSPKSSSVYSAIIRPPTHPEKVSTFSPGSLICKKGSLGDRLFILVDGVVEIQLAAETSVQIARPGSVIGEIAVFLNMAADRPEVQRTADVVCVSQVKAIVLGLDQVEPYLAEHPELLSDLLHAMIERTRETHTLIDLAQKRIHQKLFGRLRHCLEGLHNLSHSLQPLSTNLSIERPFSFAAHQARMVYQRFRETLETLETPLWNH
jgi:CRP-like cAMP-binding protein